MVDGSLTKNDNSISEQHKSDLESILTQSDDCKAKHADEAPSLISFEATEIPAQIEVTRQPSPPPVLAEVQDLVPAMLPHVIEEGCKTEIPMSDSIVRAESPLQLHIVRANNLTNWILSSILDNKIPNYVILLHKRCHFIKEKILLGESPLALTIQMIIW